MATNNLMSIEGILIDSITLDSKILECPICYEMKEDLYYGKCPHYWCMECHYKMSKYNTCPVCRTPFRKIPEPVEEIWVGHNIFIHSTTINGITQESIIETRIRNRRSIREIRNELRNRLVRRRRSLLCDCVIS